MPVSIVRRSRQDLESVEARLQVAMLPILHHPNGMYFEHCPFCTWRISLIEDDMGRASEKGQDALEDHVAFVHRRES